MTHNLDSEQYLANLTPTQREAVLCSDGPLLILAGPGSGKTRVITCRIAHLIREGVKPYQILAITFTNKAAQEMRRRVDDLLSTKGMWISTFHSLGARLLRSYADRLGLDRNFTIYDQSDRVRVVKSALDTAQIDNSRFTPETIQGAISKAKNQLLTPDKFASGAGDFFSKVVAQVYEVYEKRMRSANALDFDDLLLWPALALKNDPDLRAELDARFRYVLVDEYQDTNKAQYAIARGLSQDYPNLCVVGDPDQCLLPETMIDTPSGPRPIESLQEEDVVMSAAGWGKIAPMAIDRVMVNHYQGRLVKLRLETGATILGTPNHIGFARLRPDPGLHFTYLMWKRGQGFRIGTTRGVRASKDGVIMSGLQVRTNQEVADAVWILHTCRSGGEARYYEHYYSVRYGIPTMVFFCRGRRMDITQDWIDRLYRDIDTETGAAHLMADLRLDRRYPHHRPAGVTRGELARRFVHFTVFGDPRAHVVRPWHEHRVQLVTSDKGLRESAQERFKVRDGARGTWRIETSRKHYDEGITLARDIGTIAEDMEVVSRARLTSAKAFPFTPFSHIHPGMVVPAVEDGQVVERLVEAVDWQDYDGPVFDLSVPNTRNYVAGGLVVHNSIYKWRGADIRNILDFERDFPNAKVITLSDNFRSTQTILQVADELIAHNKQRKPKTLTTTNPVGSAVQVLEFENALDEAEQIARRIKAAVDKDGRHYRDFALFMRMNALSRNLEGAFIRAKVPYQIVRGVAFFDRKENKDILAYLRLLLNPRDDVSFSRVVNEPPRGVGKVSLDHLQSYAEPRELSLLSAIGELASIPAIKGKAAGGLRTFATLLDDLRKLLDFPPDEIIRQVIHETGYRVMLATSDDEDDQERLANIEEMITAAKQFHDEDPTRTLSDFLENITLASDADSYDEKQDCVAVMTLHAAKGLEFPVVYILAMEQGILPHERSMVQDADLEEERRLAFVGITRAKEELHLSHCRMREYRGQTLYAVASMFLDEIPEKGVEVHSSRQSRPSWAGSSSWRDEDDIPLPRTEYKQPSKPTSSAPREEPAATNFAVGALVRHETYGVGRILKVTGHGAARKLKIRFTKAGERTFMGNKVKLAIVQGT